MKYQCKFCDKREGEPQGWLLAFEFTKPGTDVRNTIFLLNKWDDEVAAGSNALQFCSKECREKYLARRHEQLAV